MPRDSMTGAKIYNDDLVVVRAQQAADNLDIAVVALGDEGTLKRFGKMGSNAILPVFCWVSDRKPLIRIFTGNFAMLFSMGYRP